MPAKIKYGWSVLLDVVRLLWSELGRAPTPNAVREAAGGGGTIRVEQVITAVGIEHGLHLTLYHELPEDLRKLVDDPKDRLESLPDVKCSPPLAAVVREAMVQIVVACETVERNALREAERLVTEGKESAAKEVAAMNRRLLASAGDAEAEARAHAAAAADYERRLGETDTERATARAYAANAIRERDQLAIELARAERGKQDARVRREQAVEQNKADAERHGADLVAVTERALRAEAERDAAGQLRERLTRELEAQRAAAEVAAERSNKEIQELRAELANARDACNVADQKRAVADALLTHAPAVRAAYGSSTAR